MFDNEASPQVTARFASIVPQVLASYFEESISEQRFTQQLFLTFQQTLSHVSFLGVAHCCQASSMAACLPSLACGDLISVDAPGTAG